MSEAALLERLDNLTSAFLLLARNTGARLTRADMCTRYGICSKTLTERVRAGKLPTPGSDGKWLLSEVVERESLKPST